MNLFGTNGNDTLTGADGNDLLVGNNGDDFLRGHGGDDTLNGDDGADFINGGAGNDVIDGGFGIDRLVYGDAPGGVNVDLANGHATGFGDDIVVDIENVTGTAYNDTLTGDNGANWLWGTGGDDSISAGYADDLVGVGAGASIVEGGDGLDTLIFDSSTLTTPVNVSLALQGAAQNTAQGMMTISGFENLVGTSLGGDTLSGDGGPNVIAGWGGSDSLSGGAGDDLLLGDGLIYVDDGGAIVTYDDASDPDDAPAGADTLIGGLGDDTINGGEGVDTVSYADATDRVDVDLAAGTGGSAAMGADTLTNIENVIGGSDSDTLYGALGDNRLSGGDGHDILIDRAAVGSGNDTLEGGAGDDLLAGGLGDDLIDGGDGFDRLGVGNSLGIGGTVDLRIQGVAQNTGLGMDTLVSIENVSGSVNNDVLIGNDGANYMWGGSDGVVGGDDTISGMGGDDLIHVGAGAQLLDGGDGVDTLMFDENGALDVTGGLDISLALQGAAQDTTQGLMTLTNFENLSGSGFGDTLGGDAGVNILAGYASDDSLSGGAGDDTLLGDGNFDIESHNVGTSGQITLFSQGDGNDNLDGGDGNDRLVGGLGNDTLDGGAGIDVAVYSGLSDDYTVNDLGGGSWSVANGDGSDQLTGVERLRFDDSFIGDNTTPEGTDATFNLRIDGTRVLAVADFGFTDADGDAFARVRITTVPTGGTLTFDGDVVQAGDLFQTSDIADGYLVFTPSSTGSTAFTFQVTDNGPSASNPNEDASPNTLTFAVSGLPAPTPTPTPTPITSGETGTSGNDVATFSQPAHFSAGAGADVVTGSSGDDQLQGNTGNDTLAGGVGNDVVYGGADNDQLRGDEGDDFLSGDLGSDTLSGGVGDDSVFGGAGDDRIDGGEGEGYLRGGAGNDVIVGGSSFDNAQGNEGDDTLSGGGGNDGVVGGKDNDQLNGDDGADIVYGNLGADTVSGGAGDDLVRGGQQNDQVSGGAGDDWLSGDRGDDTVTGGAGADTFHTFSAAGVDIVTDFNYAEGDRVQLDPGTVYTVDQIGSTVLINMGGGNYMSLQNTQLSSLGEGWIFA
ncbi:MAG: calcium-binding protein, partial [Phenylobacterium sp.]